MKIAKKILPVQQPKEECPLPLLTEDSEGEENTKDLTKFGSFKLLTNPADNASAKYSFTMRYNDGTLGLRKTIRWVLNTRKVIQGLAIANAPHKMTLVQEMCSGAAQTILIKAAQGSRGHRHEQLKIAAAAAAPGRGGDAHAGPGETQEQYLARIQAVRDGVPMPDWDDVDVANGLRATIKMVAPYKVLEKQKRFMRRRMRKPADMKSRTYVNLLTRINVEELPELPPFQANQRLPADELRDIIVYGLPRSWLREMDVHDFDPYNRPLPDVVGFAERMEASEEHEKSSSTKNTSSNKSSKKARTQPGTGGSGKKWCEHHESDTHNTSECEVLKKLKASFKSK